MATQWNNYSMGSVNAASTPIEQLWYTWSTVGLSSITTGFRIRAASGSLAEVMSPRVQNLDQYLRYDLPDGADRFDPTYAPHSLALLQTSDGERILVNKIYLGRDGMGRPGAFFAHLLARLPNEFTPQDAFLLWRSNFWRSSDAGMGNNLHLNNVSLEELRSQELPLATLDLFQHPSVDSEKLRTFLPSFISAYLMWRTEWETWKKKGGLGQPPKHLYIAAPADLMGAFLLALTLCLPDALLTGLTFSTYEKDVQSAGQSMMIVGTTMTDEMLSTRSDLPANCYTNDIALNCYYPDKYTSLDQYPLGTLALAVAKNITSKLAKPAGREQLRKFKVRKKFIENPQSVNVELFLTLYDAVYLRERKSDKATFDYYLTHPDAAAEYLGDTRIQEFGIKLASTDTEWGTNGLPRGLELLTEYSNKERDEDLTQALFDMGKLAADEFVAIAEQGMQTSAVPSMVKIMSAVSTLAPKSNPILWHGIVNAPLYILENKPKQRMLTYFLANPEIYFGFLKQWNFTLTPHTYYLLDGLLQVPWQQSERFFALNIPFMWKLDALNVSFPIPPIQIRQPGQQFLVMIKSVLRYYLEEQKWFEAEHFYRMFETTPLQYKQELLMLLLNSPLSVGQEQGLITDDNRVWFLQAYGPKYLPEQQVTNISTQFMLLQHDSAKKLAVLSTWLKPLGQGSDIRPRGFVSWLESPANWKNMETILAMAQLQSTKEITAFLENYGISYLRLYNPSYLASTSTFMSGLLRMYLKGWDEVTLRTSQNAQNIVTTLSEYVQYLPPDIQKTLEKLTRSDTVFRHATNCIELVKDVAGMLRQEPTTYRPALYEKLAQRFIAEITDETYLSEVIETMQTLEPYFALYDLFQVLLTMAHYARENLARQSKPFLTEPIVLYVNFAFFANLIFVKSNESNTVTSNATSCDQDTYTLFQKSFLDRLLKGLNGNLLGELEQRLPGKSKEGLRAYLDNIYIDVFSYPSSSVLTTKDKVVNTALQQASTCVELVKTLEWHLQQISLSRNGLRTTIANALLDQITNETYLAEVVRAIQHPFLLDDVFQILLMIAQLTRDEIDATSTSTPFPFEHVALCMNFVYHAHIILVKPERQDMITCTPEVYWLFQRSFLDRLLRGVDSHTFDNKTIQALDQVLTGEARGKLAAYLRNNRPSSSNYPREQSANGKDKNTSTPNEKGGPGLHISLPHFNIPRIKFPAWFGGKPEEPQTAQKDVPSSTQQEDFYSAAQRQPRRNSLLPKGKEVVNKAGDVVDMVFDKATGSGSAPKTIRKPK